MARGGPSITAIGHDFIDAFNRRDIDALVALADPTVEYHATPLLEKDRVYRGHDGLRRWIRDLERVPHEVRVLEVRQLGEDRFLGLTEVRIGDEVMTPSAVICRLTADRLIAEIHAYLSDEETLKRVGIIPAASGSDR